VQTMSVKSSLGNLTVDHDGSPVAVAKLHPDRAYLGVPLLLQKFINDNDVSAWAEIVKKIDYIYDNVDYIMSALGKETHFEKIIRSQVKSGKRLFFKPNLVSPLMLDPVTHGAGLGDSACTEWTVIAALMRWFHDKLNVSFDRMTIGEAASALSMLTAIFNKAGYAPGKKITTEAVLEGKCGSFYGGWQFYFVRRYLQDKHPASHTDDPMNGYEESLAGEYLSPGAAGNRLMVYDLNRIETSEKGREVPVPDGANFQKITIHKAIIGGDPTDAGDMKKYPGCVLINVPKLKIHEQDLITNAIKNLGIGLYPMEYPRAGGKSETDWVYASHCEVAPILKSEIPHTPWVPEMDDCAILPLKDTQGNLKLRRTSGMPGTQSDIIRAVQNQGIFSMHFSDAIEATNTNHSGVGMGVKIPEGLLCASLDCVALDLFCARYLIKTVPMAEARHLMTKQRLPGEFMHRVPVAGVEGKNIITTDDVDSPLFHYSLYDYAEKRGIGKQKYYVIGSDERTGQPLVSLQGHFGSIADGQFQELMTGTLYFNPNCFLWDMQKTCFTYLTANDYICGTSTFKDIMAAFDENGDGAIDYNENGKNGFWTPLMRMVAYSMYIRNSESYGLLKSSFLMFSYVLRFSEKKWNPLSHDFLKDYRFAMSLSAAYLFSRVPMENPDPFLPGMLWGNGKWPSLKLVNYLSTMGAIYGNGFPAMINLLSLYGYAFQYADKSLNGGKYTGESEAVSEPQSLQKYLGELQQGGQSLDFTLFVPCGFGKMGSSSIPNVIETDDPAKIFSAVFGKNREPWTTDFNLK